MTTGGLVPEPLTIRCSSLPRLVACAAAAVPPGVRVEPPRGPADLGTAFHECMAAIVRGEEPDEHVAERHNVDPEELANLFGWTRKLWYNRLAPLFPGPAVETGADYSDGGLTLTGTADLGALVGDEVRILDWKTGWLDADATEQLKGYAWLWLNSPPARHVPRARVTKLGVRRQTADTTVWTRDELRAWWGWLKGHLADRDTYRPGPHCGRCPRALECPGAERQLRSLALALQQPNESLCVLTPQDLARTLQLARYLGRKCQDFADDLKAHVEARGGRWGPLAIGEQTRRTIDVARGWETLRDAIPEGDLLPLLRAGKGDVEDAVKKDAPRGKKGAAAKELFDRLDAAGAIVITTHTTLEVRTDGAGAKAIDGGGDARPAGPGER
jgi:hypothetical protein